MSLNGEVVMNKYCQVLFFSAILFIKCSNENNGNPIVPPPEVLTKEGTISNEEAWSEADKIYRIAGDCSIESQVTWGEGIEVIIDPGTVLGVGNNGILTIEKGVTVKLCDESHIEVGMNSQGTLKANGSADSPVVFKADTGVQAWGSSQGGGIILGDSAKNILLNYCTVSEATSGINVKAGSPVITNCKVTSCIGNGIYFDSTAGPDDSLTFTNNTISDCGGYPLTLPADKLGNLSEKITFSGFNKENNGIHILGAL
ncbi:MAG: hypothetical protein GX556_02810, partial [Fibrobacter sp.]|nr:hypothetical protein [Fibrobacter sp.]